MNNPNTTEPIGTLSRNANGEIEFTVTGDPYIVNGMSVFASCPTKFLRPNEETLEHAFWEFDAAVKGLNSKLTLSSRDAFKLIVRGLLAIKQPEESGLTAQEYEEVLEYHRTLVRELDVAINGVTAANQASLCDIVSQVRRQGLFSVATVKDEFHKISRYDKDMDGYMEPDETGNWVRYDDVAALIGELGRGT